MIRRSIPRELARVTGLSPQAGDGSPCEAHGVPNPACQPGLPWYVVATKPQSEALAVRGIRRLGFACFCPLVEREVIRRGERALVDDPMFASYVLAQFDFGRPGWLRICETFGVSRILGEGLSAGRWRGRPAQADSLVIQRPLPLPAGFAEALAVAGPQRLRTQKVERFRAGDRVRVAVGPFAHVIGEVKGLDRRGRVRVLFRLLGASQVRDFEPGRLRIDA